MKYLAALVLLVGSALGPTTSHAAAVCDWGGTPAAPTGTFTVSAPGLSNAHPASAPLDFWASAPLAGVGAYCTGTLTITGHILPGSQCRLFYITGTVTGVPGVATFFDIGGAYSVAQFYDSDGKLVGSYGASVVHDGFADAVTHCTNDGYLGGKFWSTAEFTL